MWITDCKEFEMKELLSAEKDKVVAMGKSPDGKKVIAVVAISDGSFESREVTDPSRLPQLRLDRQVMYSDEVK